MNERVSGWTHALLGEIASITSGIGFPISYQGLVSGEFGFFKVGDITRAVREFNGELRDAQHYVSHEVLKKLNGRLVLPGSTVFAKIGEAIRLSRRAYVVKECLVDNNVMVVKALPGISDRYMFMFLRMQDLTGLSHATTVPSLRKSDIELVQVPLAPPPEQKRIADKLDTLFARVDACSARLDRVPVILKRFRQSVLTAATSGELTEAWRESNRERLTHAKDEVRSALEQRRARSQGKKFKEPLNPDKSDWNIELPECWSIESVAAFAECLDYRRIPIKKDRRRRAVGLYPYYGANGQVDLVDEYLFDDELVLVTEDETFYGREKPIAYRSSGRCWVNNHAHVLRTGDRVSADYLCFSLMYRNVIPWLTGTTGRAKLTQAALNALPLAVPPALEQAEIVRRVHELFQFADRLEKNCAAATTRVEKLTPSLLSKAFRGELVPQDPSDEPASVLLERIKAERAAASRSEPRRSQRTAPKEQAELPKSSSTPTPKRASSPQTPPARPRRPPAPEPDPEDTAATDRRPLEDYTTDEMMSHFRAASRASGEMTEEGLFHLVLARLGFERLGAKVTPILKGHLKAAIGRGIIERDGFFVRSKTPTIKHYDRSTLVDALTSVMRKNHPYEREEVIQALAVHLGYSSVSDVMRDTMKSVFNSAIRQGVLIREGSTIRLAD